MGKEPEIKEEPKKLDDIMAESQQAKELADAQAEIEGLKAQLRIANMPEASEPRPAPKQVKQQVRNPGQSMALAALDTKNFFYVKVAHTPSTDDEPIHWEEYLDIPSPTCPGEPMWTPVTRGDDSNGRRLTGSSKMGLLQCRIEDKRIMDKIATDAAGRNEKSKMGKQSDGNYEDFEDIRGGLSGPIRLAS